MLPKNKRLNLRTEYKSIVGGAARKEGRFLSLFLKVSENDFPRIGISLSGKTLKKAHQRNRARRLVSAAVEALYPSLPVNANIIITPKPEILSQKSDAVKEDLKQVLGI